MTRILFTAAAAALAAVTISGPANADALMDRPAANYRAMPTQTGSFGQVSWHYEWRYHYDRHGQWVPGWVAVLNGIR